jgi:hypothetical protein
MMSDTPSTSELIEGVLFYPIALVISATVCPGLTLCIPGLILLAAFVIVPIVAWRSSSRWAQRSSQHRSSSCGSSADWASDARPRRRSCVSWSRRPRWGDR